MKQHRLNAMRLTVLCGAVLSASAGAQTFTEQTVSGSTFGDCKGIADFDGDGLPDVVIGGPVELAWFRAPGWVKTVIATPQTEFTTDMQTADVDNDGDADVIIPDGGAGALAWFENPRPGGDPATDPWPRHLIGNHSTYAHDVELGDFDHNGKIDVVTRSMELCKLWLQQTPTSWTGRTLSTLHGEGTGVGDIDNDGDLDIALNGVWIECPTNPGSGTWTPHTFASGVPALVGVRVARINVDNRPDLVLAASESTGRMSWYEGPADPRTGPWVEHVIDASVDYVHTFQVVDISGDGLLDIVFAEMAQSSRRRVGFFRGNGFGTSWTLQVLATTGSHNIRVGDLGNDSDLDIVGCNWQGPPVTAWVNQSDPGSCYANCDHSTNPPALNVLDFICFQNAFANGNSYANCDGNTTPPLLTVNDFVCFQGRFVAGCP
jgi:hypothetical protein